MSDISNSHVANSKSRVKYIANGLLSPYPRYNQNMQFLPWVESLGLCVFQRLIFQIFGSLVE